MAHLSRLFLGSGDNFSKSYDVQQIWTKTRDLVAYPPVNTGHWSKIRSNVLEYCFNDSRVQRLRRAQNAKVIGIRTAVCD
jgi:hypothetical protein